METTKVLTVIALVAVVAAAVGLFVNLGFLGELSSVGRVSSDVGNATLEVTGIADLVFITNLINWSTGQVNDSIAGCGASSPAILTAIFPTGSVSCGTWVARPGLTLQNRGNTPVLVKLRSSNNATAGITGPFIGTSVPADVPLLVYDWRVANNATSGTSCSTFNGALGPTTFTPVNYTVGNNQGTIICANLSNSATARQLNVEFNVTIPTSAVIGTKLSQITAEAFVI